MKRLTYSASGLGKKEWQKLQKLSTPTKIQNYLSSIKFNLEKNGPTFLSPRKVISEGQAHCFEGALLGATALWIRGEKPLILDLVAEDPDFDHVVALYKRNGFWGAISKTNHSVLRYREPVFKSMRELALSYMHEYFLKDGRKTLRLYSKPFDLSKLGTDWIASEESLMYIAEKLDELRHLNLLTRDQIRNLRPVDPIERQVSEVAEWN